MITFFKNLLWDETSFFRYGRYMIFLLGAGIQQGVIPTGIANGGKYGIFVSGMALLISGSGKNGKS